MRKLKFDLNVETNALLCPNPQEFYSKAYIPTADIASNFRTLPGIKYKTKLANVLFDANLLKASSCSFNAGTDPLDAIDIDVCGVSAMAEICQFDLEQSFLALQMAKGSSNWDVPSFMSFYWDEMGKRIGNDIELIRWKGNSAVNSNDIYELCTGHEAKLCADADVIQVASTTVTASNVITEMNKVYAALPAVLQSRISDLRFHISANVAAAYRMAAFALGNANVFAVEEAVKNMTYLGIKIVVNPGMSNNTMVLTLKDNLVYAFDGEGDGKALKAVNLSDSIAEPKIRTRAEMKMGFFHTNPAEIVFYSAGPCS